MKITKRVPSVPLLILDPHFSIWSPADQLTDCSVESWTGKKLPLEGFLTDGQERYQILGFSKTANPLPQKSLDISPTTTIYQFENEEIFFELSFSSQFDLEDISSLSEPISTIRYRYEQKKVQNDLQFILRFPKELCAADSTQNFFSQKIINDTTQTIWMGKGKQTPLNNSGDLVDIDWGYLHLAAEISEEIELNYDDTIGLEAKFTCDTLAGSGELLVGYDDVSAIQYFGQAKTGLWAENEPSIFSLLVKAIELSEVRKVRRQEIDTEISQQAQEIGGNAYELITSLSYRQTIGAHKLIQDTHGKLVYLSKECSSNGCIGTVDVSYPSIPLFLNYQPELVSAMLRQIFKFASLPVWEFPYAPHDVGRYPYATGQVYGRVDESYLGDEDTPIMYSHYPSGQYVYDEKMQMPIEECGNMLIMTSLAVLNGADADILRNNRLLLNQWAKYLESHSANPESQLCTDDFAGHLANNVNLSLKGIVALSVYGKVLNNLGDQNSGKYYTDVAKKLAVDWQKRAQADGHTRLSFDLEDSWSLKYNIVWDKLLELGLFSSEIIEEELNKYRQEENKYGVPLDNRATYTKVDWLIWVASLSQTKTEFEAFLQPIVRYLEESPQRVPFSDWYDTETAEVMNFKNRTVLGAVFLPFLFKRNQEG